MILNTSSYYYICNSNYVPFLCNIDAKLVSKQSVRSIIDKYRLYSYPYQLLPRNIANELHSPASTADDENTPAGSVNARADLFLALFSSPSIKSP